MAFEFGIFHEFQRRAGQEFRPLGDLRIVETDQDAGVAALQNRRGFDGHEVNRNIAGLDHRFDLAELAGIFLLIPGLNFLVLLGLYGFYLLWVGLPLLMRVKKEQALP